MGWKMSLAQRVSALAGLRVYKEGRLWETIEADTLSHFLSHFEADCVFDVGANAGQYAQRLRDVGFKGQILSFEPNPGVAETLRAASRNDTKWSVYQTALDSVSRETTFNVMKRDQFSSLHSPNESETTAFREMNAVERVHRIRTDTLNNLEPRLRSQFHYHRPFLKMDTQGHDLAVVEGGDEVLNGFVGLQSEMAVVRLYEASPRFQEALTRYEELGFRLTSFFPNNAGHFPDLNELDCLMYNPEMRPASRGKRGAV